MGAGSATVFIASSVNRRSWIAEKARAQQVAPAACSPE
jgi:hypothetical protein